jgi:putative ABC transport system permease protein
MRVLQLRTSVAPEFLRPRIEREIQKIDPNMPITDVRPMQRILDGPQGLLIFRIGTFQAGAMGFLGFAIALVGIYGIVSYGASQRTREIGIRMALGAAPRTILLVILRQGVLLVLAGMAVGLLGAGALTRVLQRFLPHVSGADPLTFAASAAFIGLIALLACYLPAHRAVKVDPMIALRHE